jgi:single stranded DNA-binding protein
VVFGKAAESCKEYLKKGREVYIEGRLRIREFEAKDNGGKRQRAEIIANRVQFLGARPAEAKATAEVEGDLASDDAPFWWLSGKCPRRKARAFSSAASGKLKVAWRGAHDFRNTDTRDRDRCEHGLRALSERARHHRGQIQLLPDVLFLLLLSRTGSRSSGPHLA